MSSNSDSHDVAKILGVTASVIGILAFFGIRSCDDLRTTEPSLYHAAVGDCLYSEWSENGEIESVAVDCSDSKANALVNEVVYGTTDTNRCRELSWEFTQFYYVFRGDEDREPRVICAYWTP
ncbi:hypothetical protein FB566_3280 [Stackebrandtia endophytica]|uniref:Uncharacterized protein n=1 Tax=Stackebrandtia endophytica TaxID=1496996 RepID=A0A543AYR2_9ACTN|nr:hypothetical protein [Stackebrandtia endophytica]TQL77716.1 hypothetical protein FB566_3280 [Stackebrandtia endophytica]